MTNRVNVGLTAKDIKTLAKRGHINMTIGGIPVSIETTDKRVVEVHNDRPGG